MQENVVAVPGAAGQQCSHGACVHAEVVGDGVKVTSTIPGNYGFVIFTNAEWDAFLAQVREGQWDHTLSGELVA